MKNRFRISLLGFAAIVFANSFLIVSTAQKRMVFSHDTKKHKEVTNKDCRACHTLPTKNWASPRIDKQEPFPDVATFPSHTACFACHADDKFRNGGAICGTCHVVPSMRAKALLPFPIKSHQRQFTTIFPHTTHQEIIATNIKKTDVAVAHFVFASFIPAEKKPQFNNCVMCHKVPVQPPNFAARIPTTIKPLVEATADNFAPTAGFFKDIPQGHASCFTCHFQNAKPVATDCAGCHSLTTPYPGSAVVKRYSLKFDHLQLQLEKDKREHATSDCMTCHVRIVKNSDLRSKADPEVPFFTCVECHKKDITLERRKRAESVDNKQLAFQCTKCHTSAVGRFPIPPSHQNH
jgi:hypothetical protein